MRRGLICLMIGVFILLSLVTTVQAEWWDKHGAPKYGGILKPRVASLGTTSFDPAFIRGPQVYQWEYETLFAGDWALDRDIWSFQAGFIPLEYHQGLLAESWEQIGPTSVRVKLRQGVRWQNKPPVNGREFTAQDVQYSFDRLLGTGSGFTEPNFLKNMMVPNLEKVVAIDKYTVEFHFNNASANNLFQVMDDGPRIVAREWVEKGDLQNWKNAVGTGPWIVGGYVSGTSLTFNKNPDYWGYDERYPKNKLPYLDQLKIMEIADNSTALAALRTGKIDMDGMTIQQSLVLADRNPEIQLSYWPGPSVTLDLRCDNKPFTDINVRKALQLAIDRKAIAQNLYGGVVEGIPCGLISPILEGWAFPYDKWSPDLKQEYGYNPEKAKQLLASAGYPEGFKTNCIVSAIDNVELVEIIKSYLKDINVTMEVNVLNPGTIEPYLNSGKHDQMALVSKSGNPGRPQHGLLLRVSKGPFNYVRNNDARYDELYAQYAQATSMDSVKQASVDMDKYSLEQHWSVCIGPIVDPIAWQPWVKGYSGELTIFGNSVGVYYARTWIDESLRK